LANIFHISRFYSTSNYKDIESPNCIEIESEIESESKPDIYSDKKYPDKEFFSLFIGFVDGDGYIDIGEQKQYNKKTGDLVNSTIRIALGIGVDKRDLSVLETFQEKLGIGLIRPIPNTNKYRYLISRSEIIKIIIPLMLKYNVYFLNYNRHMQYSLAKHIIDNNIKQWKNLDKTKVKPVFRPNSYKDYSELPQFSSWLLGFSMAEGSFGMKTDGSAFYSIRQTGILNLPLIQAIQFKLLGELKTEIKPDKQNSYKIAMVSRVDIQKIFNFFSLSNHHPLLGYKSIQYQKFLINLKNSKRYSKLNFPII